MDDKTNIPSESEVLAFFAYAKGRLQAEFPQATYVNLSCDCLTANFRAALAFNASQDDMVITAADCLEQAIIQLRVQIPDHKIRALELRIRAQKLLAEADKISP